MSLHARLQSVHTEFSADDNDLSSCRLYDDDDDDGLFSARCRRHMCTAPEYGVVRTDVTLLHRSLTEERRHRNETVYASQFLSINISLDDADMRHST